MGFGAHAAHETAAAAVIDHALERFGSRDILVNNAGTSPAHGPAVEQDRERFMTTVEINLWAPAVWTGLAWKKWMREHDGSVINTASVGGGLLVTPDLRGARHVEAIHLTQQLALELAPGVRSTP